MQKLSGPRVVNFDESKGEFDAATRLIVVLGETAEDQVTKELVFSAADERGECRVKVVGQTDQGVMRAAELAFLEEPWHDLAVRQAGNLHSWFNVARIRLQHADGRRGVLTAAVVNGQMKLFQGNEPKGRELPYEMLEQVVPKLCGLQVERFVGDDVPASGTGLSNPDLTVTWQISPKGSQVAIPLEGEWESLRIGRLIDGTRVYVSHSRDPDLVCECVAEDLNIFDLLLNWISQ